MSKFYITKTPIEGLVFVRSKSFIDDRGSFSESYNHKEFSKLGLGTFVQDNIVHSKKGVLRGLHFQSWHPQAKLVSVVRGKVYDVAVDLRPTSATFGRWFCATLCGEDNLQFFIPEGFAHGYLSLTNDTIFIYKCSELYNPDTERGIIWNDPELGIMWPLKFINISEPLLSKKDANLGSFSENFQIFLNGTKNKGGN